jgi:hypothetical protein
MAFVLRGLAMISAEGGQYERAAELSNKALAILEKTLGPDHPNVAFNLNDLGLIHTNTGNIPKLNCSLSGLSRSGKRLWAPTTRT